MRRLALAFIFFGAVLLGCAGSPEVKKEKEAEAPKRSVLSLPAEVVKVEGETINLRIQKPAPLKTEGKLAVALAQGVIDTSYLLEGREVLLNQTRVKVARVVGDEVQVKLLEKVPPLKPGDKIIFPLERKLIAVKDFEVVVGHNKDAAKFIQEDVESLLVESGQFSVVERAKLGTILEEIQLGQTGAIDPTTAQRAGKLLGAEIILTGVLAAAGDQWNVNLRLVNTETGLVIAAVHKMGPLHELSPASIREIKNIEGSFESGERVSEGWVIGTVRGGYVGNGGFQKVHLDQTQGANGTKMCFALEFKLGSQRLAGFQNVSMHARIRNQTHRDMSAFKGVKFFVKGSKAHAMRFAVTSATKDGDLRPWMASFEITNDWKEVRIPFSALAAGRGPGGKPPTAQALDLAHVERIDWIVRERLLPPGTSGMVWLDEVSFY